MSTQTSQIPENDDFNLDDFLELPGAGEVITPTGKAPKGNIFSAPEKLDLSFLENTEDDTTGNAGEDPDKEKAAKNVDTNKILDDLDPDLTGSKSDEDEEGKNKGGRKAVDKTGAISAISKLVEKGTLFAFDDDKPLEEYTVKDIEELLEANLTEREKQLREQTPKEFFEALPEEMQYAAKYLADGGTDLKGLFRVLAQVEETRQLDVSVEADQEAIVRNYMAAKKFSQDDIDEQIEEYRQAGSLAKWAAKRKPELDAMSEEVVKQRLAQQEAAQKQAQQMRDQFLNNVYSTLEPAELNGVKLDKKKQQFLWNALTQTTHTSMSGKPTNQLGYLLEQHQFGEKPRYDLIAEAVWLLSDPDDYRAHQRQQAKNDTAQETVRTLKTEQSRKLASSSSEPDDEDKRPAARKISRPQTNIFARGR